DPAGFYAGYALNSGNEDTKIALTRVTANLVDTDGSETLAVTVQGIPVGAVLSDGTRTFTATAGNTVANVTGWNLSALTILPPLDYNGTFSLQITATSTESSNGSAASTSASFNVVVYPVNDAPVNTVPGAQTINEDTSLSITGISVRDVDGNLSTTQLTVANGSLNVSLAGGATISAGANGSATLTLSGTEAQINAALATLKYQGNANYSGADTLTVTSTDSSGHPITGKDIDTVAITVNPVNDAPVAVDDVINVKLVNGNPYQGLNGNFYNYNEGPDGANLTSVAQVTNFINTHNPNASFVGNSINYSINSGNNLGGYSSSVDNLKNWLGSDGASLVNYSRVNSGDAIIHLEGLVQLAAGTYNFRVTADDGYSIIIDGKVVAQVNANQSQATAIGAPFTIDSSGLHSIEIIYWDQGGQYVFQTQIQNVVNGVGQGYRTLGVADANGNGGFINNNTVLIKVADILANDTDV
ncbi:MAG: hypothetical protein ACRC0M_02865, partial [Legionella sp.]